jgi:hypothetical protein
VQSLPPAAEELRSSLGGLGGAGEAGLQSLAKVAAGETLIRDCVCVCVLTGGRLGTPVVFAFDELHMTASGQTGFMWRGLDRRVRQKGVR